MKIHFVTSNRPDSLAVYQSFVDVYGQANLEDADVIVSLSGDGIVLRTLHKNFERNIPVYGMNTGKVGFLTNKFQMPDLVVRLQNAYALKVYPLIVEASDLSGQKFKSVAINEVCLIRGSNQAAKMCVKIDDIVRINELVCDGMIVSTPIGSTAYNLSVGGPILTLNCGLLSLTAISSFRPRAWKGALINDSSTVHVDIIDPEDRCVKVVADYVDFRNVTRISIRRDKTRFATLLLDSIDNFKERMFAEQFATN